MDLIKKELKNKIVAAAIKINGKLYLGARHHHAIWAAGCQGETAGAIAKGKQGFVTADGTFLTRNQACLLAIKTNQLRTTAKAPKDPENSVIFSEDLW